MWFTLVLPPSTPCFWALGTFFLFQGSDAFALVSALANVMAIIFGLALFNSDVARRYQGISKTFLGWAYLLGQIIVCVGLWTVLPLLVLSGP